MVAATKPFMICDCCSVSGAVGVRRAGTMYFIRASSKAVRAFLGGLAGRAIAVPIGRGWVDRKIWHPAQMIAAMIAPTNAGVTLTILARRTGLYSGLLNPSRSAGAPDRAILERAPLMQSGQTSRPLSSTSVLKSVGRPHTAQDSGFGRSSSGGGSSWEVLA